ncbi:MAG: hypothetical protein K0R61_4798 [Microvirga sp.]|jgi:hypothetical protein|nr:hypothetical protein [Microvirga sp.]MDF2974348.1 hypothetical protein [Microvirga sp.]
MAGTMTDVQLAALRSAIASGVLTTEYQGRRITYRSLEEMRAIEREELAARATSAGTRVNYTIARFCRY